MFPSNFQEGRAVRTVFDGDDWWWYLFFSQFMIKLIIYEKNRWRWNTRQRDATFPDTIFGNVQRAAALDSNQVPEYFVSLFAVLCSFSQLWLTVALKSGDKIEKRVGRAASGRTKRKGARTVRCLSRLVEWLRTTLQKLPRPATYDAAGLNVSNARSARGCVCARIHTRARRS